MPATDKTSENRALIVQGAILAWVAVLIYASANSVVLSIIAIGAEHLVDGRNAITFCNLLFLGSLISLVPMVFFFHKEWTRENLRSLKRGDWVAMTISAILSSALTPSLFFFALEFSNVTNVVLIGRLEPPLMLLLSVFVLKIAFDKWAFAGALIALVGAVIIITQRGGETGFVFGKGEFAALFGILSFITSNILSKKKLNEVPFGVFAIYRTALGTIIYFFWALYLFGPHHFQDVFAPVVLKWTLVYAALVIIGGQFAWNLALKKARSGDMTMATSFTPVASITIAMLLLGEDPGDGIYLGGTIIIAGILTGLWGRKRKERAEKERLARENAMEHETEYHFKGA
ncbi:MAG: DMT family transporter [Gammaproteobacteria bacterium]|nr:DMT family transporter [Gammaproteobacteria bacterium]